ncbi:tyrosine-type recombinase/integrase [Brucella anthropi]|uniref:tyrosine-type recombinase/integrase n=1 Tax=Brucella anthropi TaxID=529 RepID=UPI001CFF3FB3|nr:site-specific integrase [Brucella anthropi]
MGEMARPKRTTPWIAPRNGVFYAHWYNESTRQTERISLRTADSAEAETRFAEFLLHGRELRQKREKGLTVSQALDDYFDEHVKEKCAAPRRQEDAIRNLKAFFNGYQLSEVDVPMSRDYTQARISGKIGGGKRRKVKAVAPTTVRRELNVLVAAANHALWMKREGAAAVSVDAPPERRLGQDDEAPYYTEDELLELFTLAEGELSYFVQLLYYTGARRGSIERLTRDQVKWSTKRILLQPPGKKATKKRQPIVPILKSMEEPLKALWETGGKTRLFKCADFYRPYRDLCIAAGINEERARPHVMRHTRATHLLQSGKSIYDVAKLLGDTIATVERVYGHHSHDHLAGRLED